MEGSEGSVHYHRSVDVYSVGLTYLAMIQQRTEPNGILAPKAEGSLHVAEKRDSIGRVMCTRQQYHQPELIVAVDRPDDLILVRKIKELITCQSVFEALGGKHQCSNLKDELCIFYYDFVLIPEQ